MKKSWWTASATRRIAGWSTLSSWKQAGEKLAAIRATIGEQVQEWAQNISAADFRELADALSSLTRILSNVQKG